ncbi:hypothetical protein F5I97DRAFT_1931024 [Phlebopus sp. FC_14]|nr:hypothetical protein F5I97DRAFT_1931024 [Phlebopus sp. FC_14]
MDLEEFEVDEQNGDLGPSAPPTIPEIFDWINIRWHAASRRARWMDLLGDYAGIEPFIIDGHSLIQLVIEDPLLALDKPGDPSFQILHATDILERTLGEFIKRSAQFDIVFWDENCHLALATGSGGFTESSRSLARRLLFKHLLTIPGICVHTFTNLSDPKWIEYQLLQKAGPLDIGPLILLSIAIAHVLSFVYESKVSPRQSKDGVSPLVHRSYSVAFDPLRDQAKSTPLRLHGQSPKYKDLGPADLVLKAATSIPQASIKERALLFAYIIHVILLNRLSVGDRARKLEPMHDDLKNFLITTFFPKMFFSIETVVAMSNMTIDLDIRLFISLFRFLSENRRLSLREVFGPDVAQLITTKFSTFAVPISTFAQFATSFLPRPSPPLSENRVLGLLPFSNKIFDEALAPLRGMAEDDHPSSVSEDESEETNSDEWDSDSEDKGPKKPAETQPSEDPSGYFDDGTLFNDTQHWHNHKKAIMPKHLGGEVAPAMDARQRKKKLRSDQRFMKTLHDQAATLTGASGAALHQIKIPPVGVAPSQRIAKEQKLIRSRPGSKAPVKQSKADAIREKVAAEKAQKIVAESSAWLKERIRHLDSQPSSSLEKLLSDMKRNPKFNEPLVATEIALYKVHRLFMQWIDDPVRESVAACDKYSVVILRTIKDIFDLGYSTNDIRKCVKNTLTTLGFTDYVESLTIPSSQDHLLSFRFVKLIRSKTQTPVYEFMRIHEHPVEWQLRLFGEYMDRSMDSQADPRVSFKADAWQREVLDAVDKNMSLLVVAPTSAGKTFISYYAMEKVLRGSDNGIVVYVAPTKALVSQVAAEIYARFSKDLKGGSCWAIHTRDYRIHDPQNCQILVTVPEILAIMMLSPPLAKTWAPRVKSIILDEIHTIGQQEGGSVWEQILLLAPCPIIGLSATVGAPEKFNEWLEIVQTAGGFQHKFVHHPHRYSHLRKFFYNIYEKPDSSFQSLASYKSTGRMRYLHPIAMLAFGARSIPSDLALESSDTLTLYRALKACSSLSTSQVQALDPTSFFPRNRLLQQKDVIEYDAALKECLGPMIASFDPRDPSSPLSHVITHLGNHALARVPPEALNSQPDRVAFRRNLINLVSDLHAQGDLPAILFSFDRSDCEIMAQDLLLVLERREKDWRNASAVWKRTLAQYEDWLSKAKERERQAAKALKRKDNSEEPPTETVEWQASFNPDEPLREFSFAGQHTSYSRTALEEDIRHLARSTSTPAWALMCLERGIAVHHSGMNRRYRALVESLFRRAFIRVIFATGTLALGINAPTRTSVFCGDSPFLTALMYRQCAGRAGRRGYDLLGKVVFYGLAMHRVQRLILSKLPSLGTNFPVTSTLILRLFNVLDGSGYAPSAVNAVQRLFRLPRISLGSEEGNHQLLHHLRFSIDYLRRARLLDEHGRPFNLFGIAAHLYYTEPSNLALLALLRNGVLHRICSQPSLIQAKRDFILLMSHLFGRRYLPSSYLKSGNMAEIIKQSASMVVLPPFSEDARRVLEEHDREILRIFTGYALTYSSQHSAELGPDTMLPLSKRNVSGVPTTTNDSTPLFFSHLKETAIRVVARSLFAANSGHDDQFDSIAHLARTARRGLSLNEHAIPSLAHITAPMGDSPGQFALNAYILDFYTHGQVPPLSVANAIRRGDVWFVLQEFDLTLMTVRGVLERLILRKGAAGVKGEEDEEEEQDVDVGFTQVDPTEKNLDEEGQDVGDDEDDTSDSGKKGKEERVGDIVRPSWVSDADWRVLEVVSGAMEEFNEKFKAMWA